MKKIMVSGHFDPFHDMHLDYIEQASKLGGYLVCVISSDRQLMEKKGKVNIPEQGRSRIVDLILSGLGIPHDTLINVYDEDSTVAEALREVNPDIFCRSGDKDDTNFPAVERQACIDCGIKVRYTIFKEDRHGSRMRL